MASIRTFVAICLPPEMKLKLGRIVEELKTSGADVKWVVPENFHMTLKFLGNVEQKDLPGISEAIAAAVSGMESITLVLSGLGAFPKVTRPSVIWAGVSSGADQLKALAARVEDQFDKVGFPREDRPFSPHITIGRTKTPRGLDELTKAITRFQTVEIGVFEADRVSLMKSELRPSGPIYTSIQEFALKRSESI